MTFTGKAFSDDAQIKQQYIEQMTEHIRLDNLIQCSYKEQANSHWRGCAVTCLINPPDRKFENLIDEDEIHKAFEAEPIQLPEWFGRLIDNLHEGMRLADSQRWNIRLLKAIPVGFDRWDALETRYKLKIQRRNLKRVRGLDMTDALKTEVTEAISGVIRALKTGSGLEEPSESLAWSLARSAAWSAESAESLARSAARSAEYTHLADMLIMAVKEQEKSK